MLTDKDLLAIKNLVDQSIDRSNKTQEKSILTKVDEKMTEQTKNIVLQICDFIVENVMPQFADKDIEKRVAKIEKTLNIPTSS